ncbi:MAG TPA: hypothetical protein VKZ39_01325 [Sphaerochaetaceae bacterium]|nr:hypothetical protein [Sphaerochaetaceae bacterium]
MTVWRRHISLILFFLVTVTVAADSVMQEQLLARHRGGSFPQTAEFSRIEDPLRPTHESVRVVYQAMRDFYGTSWFDQYVHSEEVPALNRLHGRLLASVLPATFTVGEASIYPDYTLVPILVKQAEMVSQRWNLILSEEERGVWKIVTLVLP